MQKKALKIKTKASEYKNEESETAKKIQDILKK
jgi:hypothetical protein